MIKGCSALGVISGPSHKNNYSGDLKTFSQDEGVFINA